MSYDATFKIVLFGDAGTGKTTLAQRFLTKLFKSDSKMTIGIDFEVKSLVVDGKKVKLQIWDFGGEERFRFLLPSYVRGANGGLFMYDVSNYSSIAHIDDWMIVINKEMRKEKKIPILVIGGKADLADAREVSSEEGINIAKSRGVDGFIECSSKTGENVDETFEALTRLMLQNTSFS
ncbi:MAG: Rab family GTPase [Promethearchaeota archaeon]